MSKDMMQKEWIQEVEKSEHLLEGLRMILRDLEALNILDPVPLASAIEDLENQIQIEGDAARHPENNS